MKVTVMPIVTGGLDTVTKGLVQGGLGNNGTGGDCSNYYICEIGQNNEKSPGDLSELAITKT